MVVITYHTSGIRLLYPSDQNWENKREEFKSRIQIGFVCIMTYAFVISYTYANYLYYRELYIIVYVISHIHYNGFATGTHISRIILLGNASNQHS